MASSRLTSTVEPGPFTRGSGCAGATEPADEPNADPESVARAICLRLLTVRPRSRQELADALAVRGAPEEVARRVLDRYVEVGLIDDAEFARMLTASRVRERGSARRAVAAELRRRGVEDDVATEALAVVDSNSELRTAQALVARRRRSLAAVTPQVQRRRLLGYLARRGYPAATSERAVRAAMGDDWATSDPGPAAEVG